MVVTGAVSELSSELGVVGNAVELIVWTPIFTLDADDESGATVVDETRSAGCWVTVVGSVVAVGVSEILLTLVLLLDASTGG